MKGCIFKISTCLLAFDNAGTAIREGSKGFHVEDLCSHVSHSISSQYFGLRSSNGSHAIVKCTYMRVYAWVCGCGYVQFCLDVIVWNQNDRPLSCRTLAAGHCQQHVRMFMHVCT
jgi:hypothetical protein